MTVAIRIRGGEKENECEKYAITDTTITHPDQSDKPFKFNRIFKHDDTQLFL